MVRLGRLEQKSSVEIPHKDSNTNANTRVCVCLCVGGVEAGIGDGAERKAGKGARTVCGANRGEMRD